jgi:hypothetical protein
MNKLQLAKLAGMNINKIDFALPQSYFNHLLNNKSNIDFIVWSYEDKSTFGEPKNIAEEFIYNSRNKILIDFDKTVEYLGEYQKELNKICDKRPFYITLMELIELLNEKGLIEYEE